jgi:hypothetical protein
MHTHTHSQQHTRKDTHTPTYKYIPNVYRSPLCNTSPASCAKQSRVGAGSISVHKLAELQTHFASRVFYPHNRVYPSWIGRAHCVDIPQNQEPSCPLTMPWSFPLTRALLCCCSFACQHADTHACILPRKAIS